jgi:hypothetical protein
LTDTEFDGSSHSVSVSEPCFALPQNCGRKSYIGADRAIAQMSTYRVSAGVNPKFRVIRGCNLRRAFRTKSG